MDVAVIFHASTRVKLKEVNKIFKPFLENLFKDSEIDSGQVRVSLGYFNKNFKLSGNLLKYKTKADYADAVLKLPNGIRGKAINGGVALKKVRTKVFKKKFGDRPDAANVIVLITDEKTNLKPASFAEEAETLRDSGVKIVTLGIANAKEDELKAVSSKGGNTFMIAGYDGLATASLTEQLRTAMYIRKFLADKGEIRTILSLFPLCTNDNWNDFVMISIVHRIVWYHSAQACVFTSDMVVFFYIRKFLADRENWNEFEIITIEHRTVLCSCFTSDTYFSLG